MKRCSRSVNMFVVNLVNKMFRIKQYDHDRKQKKRKTIKSLNVIKRGECLNISRFATCAWGHKIYIFFGFTSTKDWKTNAIYIFNLLNTNDGWNRILINKNGPKERQYCSVEVFGDSAFIFGGNFREQSYGDFWEYHFEKNLWKMVECKGDQPKPRYLHSTCKYGHLMYLFGGISESTFMGDLFEFDHSKNYWREILGSGDVPSNRFGSAIAVYNNQLFLIGGFDGHVCTDIYCLDFASYTWTQIQNQISSHISRVRVLQRCYVVNNCLFVDGFKTENYSELLCIFHIKQGIWDTFSSEELNSEEIGTCILGDSLFWICNNTGLYESKLFINDKLSLLSGLIKHNFIDLQFKFAINQDKT